ncbi:MAG: nucleotidyltransferase family protein [Erythrobacter sp.]
MVEISSIDVFLAQALRAIRAGEIIAWPEEMEPSREAMATMWERVDVHGIAGLLHHDAHLLVDWPEHLRERIAEEARLVGLWETTHRAALSKLLKELARGGVETVLMKGTAIAYSLHQDPAVRRRGDSDLLVRPSDLGKVRATLKKGGWFRNEDPHGLVNQEGWLAEVAGHFLHKLDLHWEPSERPALQEVLPREDFFARSRPLPRLSPDARAADPAMIVIHETINQKWHLVHGYATDKGEVRGARRLIWSVDFALLADTLDKEKGWERLVELCGARGVGPLVAEALRGASQDLGTSLPRASIEALERQVPNNDIVASIATNDSLGEFWIDLRTATSWRQRLRLIGNRGLPPRAHLLAKYPKSAGWPTALLQGRLLVETAGRVIRRAASR